MGVVRSGSGRDKLVAVTKGNVDTVTVMNRRIKAAIRIVWFGQIYGTGCLTMVLLEVMYKQKNSRPNEFLCESYK